ncbi:hypothetical protein EUGRSUZ_K00905 [Eucalyptus grandis]|uniref:Uncharacterized protein n=2 Tax=Eucalyptus grandis TaxID=71139 RepID=A0ACC3IRY0_EUCGR|nr:hypothetical protein EUGRSUZ_K00905 [Eucalyptus grandis]
MLFFVWDGLIPKDMAFELQGRSFIRPWTALRHTLLMYLKLITRSAKETDRRLRRLCGPRKRALHLVAIWERIYTCSECPMIRSSRVRTRTGI